MNIIQQADLLLVQAEEHVQSALRDRLDPEAKATLPDPLTDRETMAADLRIRFLFPQLPEMTVRWLIVLHWQRRTLTRLVNTPQLRLSLLRRTHLERAIRHLEQGFVAVVGQVEKTTSTVALSPAQLAILDREFFHVPFLEPAECGPAPINSMPPELA